MKMTPFKKTAALAAIIVTLSTLVSPAFAAESLYVSNSELNVSAWMLVPTVVNGTVGGRIFDGNDEYLSRVTFYIRNDSVSESGTLRAVLFNTTNGVKPDDASNPVATSTDTYNAADLTGQTLVTFSFADTFLLNSGTSYGIALEVASTLGSYLEVGVSDSGGLFYDLQGDRTWISYGKTSIIYIYTDDEEGGGAPYTPPGTADTTSWDNLISSFTSFIVPLLVVMLPAFLLCFITKRVDKWLIIIGVTIGAGLGYYFNLVPLWLVFLVTIGLIGMAYQSVRGGNS